MWFTLFTMLVRLFFSTNISIICYMKNLSTTDSNNPLLPNIIGQGKNALAIRHQNELAVLRFLMINKKASRLDLAFSLGVTSQAIAIITSNLLKKKMIKVIGKQYDNIPGQPPAIYALNPEAVISLGINIGRTHTDVMLINFCGRYCQNKHFDYDYPEPQKILEYILSEYKNIKAGLNKEQISRFLGAGISMPYHMHIWNKELKFSKEIMAKWENTNIHDDINKNIKLPIFYENDATAATIGEIFYGAKRKINSFMYIYIGTFPGGGVVINGKLVHGHNNNAGAVGGILVPPSNLHKNKSNGSNNSNSPPVQLLQRASLNELRKYLAKDGIIFNKFTKLFSSLEKDTRVRGYVEDWVNDISEAIAYATISANALMDFEGVVIDAALPDFWIQKIVDESQKHYKNLEHKGIPEPQFIKGSHGVNARALGSAALAIYKNFSKA